MTEQVTPATDKMQVHHWIAALGIGFLLIGPTACLIAWMLGRDGQTAISFAMIFVGLGWIIIWVAAQGTPGDEE